MLVKIRVMRMSISYPFPEYNKAQSKWALQDLAALEPEKYFQMIWMYTRRRLRALSSSILASIRKVAAALPVWGSCAAISITLPSFGESPYTNECLMEYNTHRYGEGMVLISHKPSTNSVIRNRANNKYSVTQDCFSCSCVSPPDRIY